MCAVLRPDIDEVVATGVTADELATRGDDGYRYDLIEGDLIRMSPGGFRHGRLAAELAFQLRGFLARHPELGVVVGAETGFRLARDPDTVLGPDAAVVRRDRLPPAAQQTDFLELAPDLVVEIVSPSDRWTTVSDKVEAYLVGGVRLVWIVEPNRRAVRVYTSGPSAGCVAVHAAGLVGVTGPILISSGVSAQGCGCRPGIRSYQSSKVV